MNVLLIPSHFPTRREPQRATYIRDYARSLALQHEVTVIYPQQLGAQGAGDERFFSEQLIEPRVRLVNYTYRHFPKSWLLSYLNSYRRIFRRIRGEWKIDIIFAHIAQPAGQAALFLGKLFDLPVVLVEHFGPPRDWIEWSPYPRWLQRKTLGYTYRQVNYLGTVSRSLALDINAFFGATVHGQLYNPVDCEMFRPGSLKPNGGPLRVVCVTRGHIKDLRKGVSNLLSAWEIVARRSAKPVVLEIVGELVEQIAPAVEAMGLTALCRIHGWLPPDRLARLMQQAALVVIPSAYETFARSGAEALCCGVPVVATKCGGPEEYVEEGTGVLVPTGDAEALADAILIGLERSHFLSPDELAARAREHFSYEGVCRRFTEVAREILGGRR
ncbi:MAG TPA: glycosyltransferase [Blastocatellia bacterium]|nr:glycosyltransferase [Blastocatellia bacterium]